MACHQTIFEKNGLMASHQAICRDGVIFMDNYMLDPFFYHGKWLDGLPSNHFFKNGLMASHQAICRDGVILWITIYKIHFLSIGEQKRSFCEAVN